MIGGTALEELFPARDVAYAAVAFYAGINLLTHLDPDRSRTDAIFALAERLAPLAGAMLQTR
jgi:hypothetical protein